MSQSSKGVWVFMWDSRPCPSQARSCSHRLGGSRGAPVNVCRDSRVWWSVVVVCVGSVGGRTLCRLGPCLQLGKHRNYPSCTRCQRSSVSSVSQATGGRIPRREGVQCLSSKLCVDIGPHRTIIRDWRKSVV